MSQNIKRNIYLMFAMSFLQGMVFYAPVATLYRQSAGVTVFQITIIESISLALCLALELPWGIVADRIGYKRTMVFCCALYFLSKIVFWRAEGFVWFLAERIMISVVISGMSGVDTSILFMSCEEGSSQKNFALFNNFGTAGLLVASLVYSVFIGKDYRLSGLLTVFSYGLAMIITFFLVEVKTAQSKEKSARQGPLSQLAAITNNKRFLLFLVGTALLSETHQTITVFLNQLLFVRSGMQDAQIGITYVIITLIGMLGVFSDKITKKIGGRRLGAVLYVFAIVSCVVMMFSYSAILSVLAIVILRIAYSMYQPLQLELQNQAVVVKDRATALSINAVIIDSVGIATNIIFGRLAESNLSGSFAFGGLICAIGLVMFLSYTSSLKRRA